MLDLESIFETSYAEQKNNMSKRAKEYADFALKYENVNATEKELAGVYRTLSKECQSVSNELNLLGFAENKFADSKMNFSNVHLRLAENHSKASELHDKIIEELKYPDAEEKRLSDYNKQMAVASKIRSEELKQFQSRS